MDTLTKQQRSDLMRKIKGRNTKPEKRLRRLLRALNQRFKSYSDLPGTPDIVIPAKKKVIFLHGCYWHAHSCKNGKMPKTNKKFWAEKFRRNKERDAADVAALENKGWSVLVVWECELKNECAVRQRLAAFLSI